MLFVEVRDVDFGRLFLFWTCNGPWLVDAKDFGNGHFFNNLVMILMVQVFCHRC